MRTKRGVALGALWLCIASVGIVQPANADSSKGADDCAQPTRPTGYISDIKFPGGGRQIRVYDVDYVEAHDHPPVCLSIKANDMIFWTRRSGGKFKLKFSPQNDAAKCGQHPFKEGPPTDGIYGHLSGPLRRDAEAGCVYDVVLEKEGESPSDPHIRVTP